MKNPTGHLRASRGATSSPWKKSRTPPVTGHCACKTGSPARGPCLKGKVLTLSQAHLHVFF